MAEDIYEAVVGLGGTEYAGSVKLTAFCGPASNEDIGEPRAMVQLTLENHKKVWHPLCECGSTAYVGLTKSQAVALRDAITEWIKETQ